MNLIRELRRRARHLAPPVLGACLAGYFAYHAIQGDRGITRWIVLRQELAQAERTLATTTAEREIWQRNVGGLKKSSLDADLLDERARAMLGLVRPDELIVLMAPSGGQLNQNQ
jgi:cell division protein FtsB